MTVWCRNETLVNAYNKQQQEQKNAKSLFLIKTHIQPEQNNKRNSK